tara:strand:- start:203 stop:796 length:594 start_codon:yes stop_codon:yes gene_type:complete
MYRRIAQTLPLGLLGDRNKKEVKTMKTYGLIIQERNNYSKNIEIKLMCREDDAEYPINPRYVETSYDEDTPKHMKGLSLDGLTIDGFWSDCGDLKFIGFNYVEYMDRSYLKTDDINAMAKTLKKINKVLAAHDPREPADYLMALAAALKLDWCVSVKGKAKSSYSDNNWHWMSIPEGRNALRHLIEDTKPAEQGIAA